MHETGIIVFTKDQPERLSNTLPYKVSKQYGIPNKKSEFITLKDADHDFIAYGDETGESKESMENKEFVIEKIIKWIKKWG